MSNIVQEENLIIYSVLAIIPFSLLHHCSIILYVSLALICGTAIYLTMYDYLETIEQTIVPAITRDTAN